MSFNSWLQMHHLMPTSRATCIVCAAAAALAAITLTAPSASAAYVNVFGGPTFTPGDGVQYADVAGVNDAGAAVGNVYTEASALDASFLAVRWDSSGAPAIELGLGGATDINEAGTTVGYVTKHLGTGDPTSAAVRWDSSGAATELMILGTPPCCGSFAYAYSINDAGAAVGSAEKYVEGLFERYHAVRWDASGTAATELESLGGFYTEGTAINAAGAVVGWARKVGGVGFRAVRWEASGTAVTELDNLGTDASGVTETRANDINTAGTAVGSAEKYDAGVSKGYRAVRWDASGTAATELGNLGTDTNDVTQSSAVAINDAGTAVGFANMYDSLGKSLGFRAVRWDASGTAATELGNLGANSDFTETNVFAINDAGIAVGYADDYDGSGTNLGERAVYWGLDGVAVDLNTLIDPVSGWTLNRADAISNTLWIGGSGAFDPDGAGGLDAYARLFLIQVPVPSALPGDYNQDGTVDATDYVVWRKGLGTIYAQDHYNIWRGNFGETLGSGSGASANATIPEPTTLVMLMLAAAGWCLWRHRAA